MSDVGRSIVDEEEEEEEEKRARNGFFWSPNIVHPMIDDSCSLQCKRDDVCSRSSVQCHSLTLLYPPVTIYNPP